MGLTFTHDHIQKIIDKLKNQTRRAVKPGESALGYYPDDALWRGRFNSDFPIPPDVTVTVVYTLSGRRKWRVGDTYAVQPGRGKPGVWWTPVTGEYRDPNRTILVNGRAHVCSNAGVDAGYRPLRIRLLSIRREKLPDISEADAVAEGCAGVKCGYCNGVGYRNTSPVSDYVCNDCKGTTWRETPEYQYRDLWERINGPKSWDSGDVWALTFEVVR